MRFAVIGAGAIGGFLAGALARSGMDVSVVARGEHLRTITRSGLNIRSQIGDFTVSLPAAGDLRDLERPDVILLTVKAHQLRDVLEQLKPYREPSITIIPMQNGIPFWYSSQWHLESVDPGGEIAQAIAQDQIVGSVVQVSGRVLAPGAIEQSGRRTYVLGEPSGERTERVQSIAGVFERAQLHAPVDTNIRWAVWYKLLGNVSLNPISALTRATIKTMIDDASTRSILRELMEECIAVARATGIDLTVDLDDRLALSGQLADVKTSMLQDLEARRPLELEPIVGAVVELAARLHVPVPITERVYALTRLLECNLQN